MGATYNERLFTHGIRGGLHTSRFRWLNKKVGLYCPEYATVLELGCFDGKAIDWLPTKPRAYLGLDANWEGGLQLAHDRWKDATNYAFRHCNTPEKMGIGTDQFDISICMETLEHVPVEMVGPYLAGLSAATRQATFITVPNEIGPVFLLKYIAKILMGNSEKYSVSELVYQTLGQTDRVRRNQHKGFDYRRMLDQISRHFRIVDVSGFPFEFLPACLNFGVGFVCYPDNHVKSNRVGVHLDATARGTFRAASR